MTVRIIKKSWWVDFTVNSTRYRKRSPENTKAGAQAYEATLRQKLARGELIDIGALRPEDLIFAEFAPKWFEDYVRPNNKYSEQLMKKYILSSSLLPFFGRKPIGEIRAHEVLPKTRPAGAGICRGYAHAGGGADEPFNSDIGALLPIALWGRTSLYNKAQERPQDRSSRGSLSTSSLVWSPSLRSWKGREG